MHKTKTGRILGICACVMTFISCTENLNRISDSKILQASWDSENKILEISGTGNQKTAPSLQIISASNKISIGDVSVRADNSWQLKLANPPLVPCRVQLNSLLNSQQESDSTSSINVSWAPANCDIETRTGVNINAAANVTTYEQIPVGTITEPPGNMSINAGESVYFSALASTTGASYSWQFDGATSDIKIQNPGKIKFTKPGVYRIKLTVTNSNGIQDTTPDERLITVNIGQNNGLVGILSTPPPAIILLPSSGNVINVGDSLYFAAYADPNNVLSALTYRWDFNGATKNSHFRVPGLVTFYKAGNYQISLTTFDQQGTRSQTAATVNLTVLASGNVNQAPNSIIQSPISNRSISTGDSINFSGAVTDPENNMPFNYTWNFDGAFANENVLDPGNKTFNTPGIYKITFTAIDSLGQADTNPPSRFITVNDVAINAAHLPESTITSPASDMQFDIGTTVSFTGQGMSADGNTPFTFLWTFSDFVPDSMMETPDPVLFDTAGVFLVTFTVTDSLAQADPTPAQIIITIVDPAAGNPAPADPVPTDGPIGEIISPDGDMTIAVGGTVDFVGSGDSPAGNDPVTYLWNFGGAAPESTEQTPGTIIFDTEGVFEVSLTVTDSLENVDPNPPVVTITVTATPPADTPPPDAVPGDTPVGEILLPATDMTIAEGESVEFAGMGTSPVGNDPVTYLWDFDGGAPESQEQIPGLVAFNMAGIFEVSLITTDSTGVVDPDPPTVIITVETTTAPVDPTDPTDPVPDPVPADPAPVNPAADAPLGEILSPGGPMTITVGDSLEFIGEGDSPLNSPLSYLWTFGGAAPDSTAAEPGVVLFETEGVFIVTLTVTDETGASDPEPPTVEITVEP
ncbi:MAG: PKD domain-containing protein [Gammaproteobacteria bacterium]|nr:PKD domain-containing protein [Gammaproteobacteria bacterium]